MMTRLSYADATPLPDCYRFIVLMLIYPKKDPPLAGEMPVEECCSQAGCEVMEQSGMQFRSSPGYDRPSGAPTSNDSAKQSRVMLCICRRYASKEPSTTVSSSSCQAIEATTPYIKQSCCGLA